MAGISDLRTSVRRHLARIPQVALCGGQGLFAAGHKDLVGGLRLAALIGRDGPQGPAQARLGAIDAQRIGEVFAAEVFRLDSAGRAGRGCKT